MTGSTLRAGRNAVTLLLWAGLLKAGLAMGALVAVAARYVVGQ